MQLQGLHSAVNPDRRTPQVEKTIGAWEARRRFGQLLEEAFYNKDRFVVKRSGRPMAVIVPIDAYEKWQRLSKERIFKMVEAVWGRTQYVPAEELEADTEQALRILREELLTKQDLTGEASSSTQ